MLRLNKSSSLPNFNINIVFLYSTIRIVRHGSSSSSPLSLSESPEKHTHARTDCRHPGYLVWFSPNLSQCVYASGKRLTDVCAGVSSLHISTGATWKWERNAELYLSWLRLNYFLKIPQCHSVAHLTIFPSSLWRVLLKYYTLKTILGSVSCNLNGFLSVFQSPPSGFSLLLLTKWCQIH